MLYIPELLVVVSVDTPVAPFLAETFAPPTPPSCASVIVPDSVAPATCARSGVAENKSPRAQLKTRNLTIFGFIGGPPFGISLNPKTHTAHRSTLNRKKAAQFSSSEKQETLRDNRVQFVERCDLA